VPGKNYPPGAQLITEPAGGNDTSSEIRLICTGKEGASFLTLVCLQKEDGENAEGAWYYKDKRIFNASGLKSGDVIRCGNKNPGWDQ
jgi:hypothetical protein